MNNGKPCDPAKDAMACSTSKSGANRSPVLVMLALSIWLAATPASGAEPPTQLAVYRWAAPNGPQNVDAYIDWIGQPDMWAEDFTATDSWANLSGPAWQLNPWRDWVAAQPARRLIYSVGVLPNISGISLEEGATGAYNHHFETLAENLVAKGLGNSIIRLGWEFNGGWYKWAANGKTQAFIDYWREIVTTMRAVPGTEGLEFCWNPVQGWQQFLAEQAYPGDTYVDYIALDVYDESWATDTYPWPAGATATEIEARRAKVWDEVILNGVRGLTFWQNFAATHDKPFALGEWGVNSRSDGHGGMDNALFIRNMHAYMMGHPVAWAVYFDVQAPDGHHQLSPGAGGTDFPEARAAFLKLFGGGGGQTFFNDTFEDGAATGWSAGENYPWTVVQDAGNHVYNCAFGWSSSGVNTRGLIVDDALLQIRVKITQMEPWSYTYIYRRYQDADNHYRLTIMKESADTRLVLNRRANGVTTTLASVDHPFALSDWHEVRFRMQGSQLTAEVNGVPLIDVSDSNPLPAGQVALSTLKQEVYFDDIILSANAGTLLKESFDDGMAQEWTPDNPS